MTSVSARHSTSAAAPVHSLALTMEKCLEQAGFVAQTMLIMGAPWCTEMHAELLARGMSQL